MTLTALGSRAGSTARTVASTYASLSLTPPTWLTDSLDTIDRAASVHIEGEGVASARFVDAVFDAVMDGRAPQDDGEVQALAARHLLKTYGYGIDEALRTRPGRWADRQAADHADEIVNAWRKPFDAAAKALAGCPDLDDAAAVIAAVTAGWTALYTQRGGQVGTDYRLLVFADANDLALEAVNRGELKATPQAVAEAGIKLSLPQTFAAYRERVEAVQAAASQRAMALTRNPTLTQAQSAWMLSQLTAGRA